MSERIRMSVIGIGGFGWAHANGIIKNSSKCELVSVCDINEEMARQRGEEFGVKWCTDYKEILSDESVDAVSVATPDFLHADIVCDALKAGKHVLCEKPLALNLDDCKKMISEAKKHDKIFMVGQICRYTPAFVKAKEIVDSGEIGELYFMESEYAHDYSHMPTDCWRTRPDRHGIVGGGCHAVDLIRWFMGNPEEVFGYACHKVLPDWPTDDCTIGIMKFSNGNIGKVFCSTGCKRDYTMRTVIYGTKGTIIVDNTSHTFTLFKDEVGDGQKIYGTDRHAVGLTIPVEVANHNIGNEVSDFIDLINSDEEVVVNAIEGASTVSVCLSIVNSTKTGVPEKVDYKFE